VNDESDSDYARWLKDNPAPDLQELVRRAGERYARSLGEPFDPTNPEHGGYQHITPAEWEHFDKAMAEWQARRRTRYGRR
jgi:hypothetical protein